MSNTQYLHVILFPPPQGAVCLFVFFRRHVILKGKIKQRKQKSPIILSPKKVTTNILVYTSIFFPSLYIQNVFAWMLLVSQSHSNRIDCNLPGSSDHVISQVRKQEYWSELPFPSPGDLITRGIEPMSPVP